MIRVNYPDYNSCDIRIARNILNIYEDEFFKRCLEFPERKEKMVAGTANSGPPYCGPNYSIWRQLSNRTIYIYFVLKNRL